MEKIVEDLFVFKDQLQGVSNLPEADRKITCIDFELLVQPASVELFVRLIDLRRLSRILLVESLRTFGLY